MAATMLALQSLRDFSNELKTLVQKYSETHCNQSTTDTAVIAEDHLAKCEVQNGKR